MQPEKPPKWSFPANYYDCSQKILETALDELPAYRSWRAFDPGRNSPIDARFAAMPVLTKRDIRENFPEGFVPRGRDIKRGIESGEICFVTTSGTIDLSVTNIWNQTWWDAAERASWKLSSHASRLATGSRREAILANPRNVGFISDDPDLPMEKRRLARFLYLNEKTDPTSWSPGLMDRMIGELSDFQPAVLEANPSLLARLSRYIAAQNRKVYQPGLIVFTYEYPTNLHRRQISRAFDVPQASSYGSTETGYVFMQCEEGKFHQNTDFCRVDFEPLKPEHGGPFLGRILVTTFNNPWYYIIHFDAGDLVRLEESGKCPCGRDQGLILSAIEGRAANATVTLDGRLVTQREIDDVIFTLDNVDEYQLIQETADEYNLIVASEVGDKEILSNHATDLLIKLYGRDARIAITYVKAVSPETSGKYRTSKALFPIDIEKYLDAGIIGTNLKR